MHVLVMYVTHKKKKKKDPLSENVNDLTRYSWNIKTMGSVLEAVKVGR